LSPLYPPCRVEDRSSEEGQRPDAERIASRQQRDGAAEEFLRRRDVATVVGTRARAGQQFGRAASGVGLVREVELAPVERRLLEVVAENLLELTETLCGRALEPAGEALVKIRAQLLCHRFVRRVAD
jgi:hypothetical protein